MKQIRDASYSDGTSHHEETVWEYDENGQCTGTTETAPDGVFTTEFEFDENGNETKMVYNGYDSFVVTMEYDADGNMTYSRQEYTDGSSVSEEYFEYDSEGRVIKDSETTKSGDSESSFTITYTYE